MLTTQGRCPFAAGGQIIHQHPLGRDPPPHPSLFWQDAAPRLDTTFTPGRHELAGGGGGAPLGVCRRFATGEPPPLFPIFLLLSSSTVGTNIGTTPCSSLATGTRFRQPGCSVHLNYVGSGAQRAIRRRARMRAVQKEHGPCFPSTAPHRWSVPPVYSSRSGHGMLLLCSTHHHEQFHMDFFSSSSGEQCGRSWVCSAFSLIFLLCR